MISSIFGVAAAKVTSISETIQNLNPTETLENALKPSNNAPISNTATPTPVHVPSPRTTDVRGSASNRSSSVPAAAVRRPIPPEAENATDFSRPTQSRTLTPTERLKSDNEIPLPDLSGLSAEEQQKILAVLERQSDETASEQQILE